MPKYSQCRVCEENAVTVVKVKEWSCIFDHITQHNEVSLDICDSCRLVLISKDDPATKTHLRCSECGFNAQPYYNKFNLKKE